MQLRTRGNSLFLFFEFAEGSLLFCTFQKPLDIGSVHKDCQQANQHTHHSYKRLMIMQQREADAESSSRQDGTQRHIAGHIQANHKHSQNDQRTAPVRTDCYGERGIIWLKTRDQEATWGNQL